MLEMQKQMMQNEVARDELIEAFKGQYVSIVANKPKVLHKIVCGSVSRQLLSKVLQLRQHIAGLFLQSIKSVKKPFVHLSLRKILVKNFIQFHPNLISMSLLIAMLGVTKFFP